MYTGPSPVSNTNITVCILCQKCKYKKGTRTREHLVNMTDIREGGSLRDCALQKKDEKIIDATRNDAVSGVACYHKSCYRL